MICPWCSYENSRNANFCGDCGHSLRFDVVCPDCSSANPAAYEFCDTCGSPLGAPTAADEAPATQPEPLTLQESPVTHEPPSAESSAALSEAPSGAQLSTPIGLTNPLSRISRAGLEAWLVRNRAELALVALLTGIGAFLRIYLIEALPPGLHGDEAWTGLEAMRILRDGYIGPWSPSALGQPAGTFYWTALLFRFIEPSLFSLRLSIALLGVATIPAFYVFTRVLFGRMAATIGSVLLVVSLWHLHYSRIAFPVVSLPLVECVALYFLVRGLREGRNGFLVAAGATSALGVYVYGGFISFALALLLFWAFLALAKSRPRRRLGSEMLYFGLPALVVAIPFLHTLTWSPTEVLSYSGISSAFRDPAFQNAEEIAQKLDFLVDRLRSGIVAYGVGRQLDYTDGMGARGLLDVATLGLVVIGASVAVWWSRDWRYSLLMAGLLAGVFTTAYFALPSWGENRRGIGALPMVFALAGLGGETLVLVWRRWLTRRLAYAALGIALGLAVFINLQYYFGSLASAPETRWVFVEELTAASRYLKSLPPDELYVYFYSSRWSYDYETRRFLAPGVPGGDRSSEFGPGSLLPDSSRKGVVFLLLPPYQELIKELRLLHPDGRYYENRDGDRFIFGAYHVEQEG